MSPTRGQFLSQDPMSWGITAAQLLDPQQLNSYSYARGNPIVGRDNAGLLTVVIPGTWYSQDTWASQCSLNQTDSANNFLAQVGDTFGEVPTVINSYNTWSGADNNNARVAAATSIASMVNNYKFTPGEKYNIVGLSHGGNDGIMLANQSNHVIDNLVTMGTPVRSDYVLNPGTVKNHVNLYSSLDLVQAGGGSNGYQEIGNLVGGPLGAYVGSKIKIGEFGSAGRIFPGAINLNVTLSAPLGLLSSHSMWRNASVWEKAAEKINSKK